ncbi:MAG: response regulator [Caldimonas sp.]
MKSRRLGEIDHHPANTNRVDTRPSIVLLEDSDIDAELICIQLDRSPQPFRVVRAARRIEFEKLLTGEAPQLILADYSLPDFDGMAAMSLALAAWPAVPFVFLSGVGGEELATEALRRGATDYVLKRNLNRLVGSILRALAEARERAQREFAEQALAGSEARMRLAMDAAELGLWDYSADTRTLALDERCQRMFGIENRESVSHDDLLARVVVADCEPLAQALRGALAEDDSGTIVHECRSFGPDGQLHWVVFRGQRQTGGPNAEGTRLTGVLQDVSSTRRLEARQRQTEMVFRIAAQATGVGIWEIGPGPDEVWFDDSYREMARLPRDLSRTLAEVMRDAVHPDDRERLSAALAHALDEPDGEIEIEHRLIGYTDRALRWVGVKGRRLVGIDGLPRLVGTVRDITEQRAMQQALRDANLALEQRVAERTRELTSEIGERAKVEDTLRQMQRLEAVGQLTSGVAHDFNNLLTVVLSNISLIERLLGQQPTRDERVTKRLDSMRDAATRGATLTRQLLAFSRRQRLEPQSVDFNEIVLGMRDILQTTMGGSVHLETDLAGNLWPALADATQLELIILNLAINARDAMEVGGSLKVQTANVRLVQRPRRPEEPEPGEYVMLSVVDSGSGMPDAVLAKAFEPFFTTKEFGKGSGLGLAQVYGFVKQSGGGVRIDTVPDEGTAVHVYLPRSASGPGARDAADVPAEPPRLDAGVVRTLLLVDDDDAVREASAALLEANGFRVVQAPDASSALAHARERTDLDAVIADFAMPRMNGAELAKALRTSRPELPVLFMTGFAELGALDDVPEDFVLQKPIAEVDLVARVHRLLAN